MAAIPPVTSVPAASDNWDDDDDFAFDNNTQPLAISTTPSSSSSSTRSRLSTSSSTHGRPQISSPLRHTVTSPTPVASRSKMGTIGLEHLPSTRTKFDEDFMSGFDDIDDLGGDDDDDDRAGDTIKLSSSKMGGIGAITKRIKREVVKTTAVGSITRFEAPPSALSQQSQKARERAMTEDWEGDLEFDQAIVSGASGRSKGKGQTGSKKRGALVLPAQKVQPDATDALDQLDLDEDDENQATIKATDTFKAQLPPRPIRPTSKPFTVPIPPEESMEDDFVFPLNMTNLKLNAQFHAQPDSRSLPTTTTTSKRSAGFAAAVGDEWGSPNTQITRRSVWSDRDSPKRYSETSATSITSIATPRDGLSVELDEDDDPEAGLDISGKLFSDARTLRERLDAKRHQAVPSSPSVSRHHRRDGTDETSATADSMEDGLVFDNPRADLSNRRLAKMQKSREAGRRNVPGSSDHRRREQEAKERELERNWGRNTPLPVRERTQGAFGLSGLRSHSAGTVQSLKDASSARRADSPSGRLRPRASLNIIPPVASSSLSSLGNVTGAAAPPTTPHRALRTQKSLVFRPAESPSSNLLRKQSLPSLQEENRSLVSPVESHSGVYSSSTSRLLQPTQSSLNKSKANKSRPSVKNAFMDRDFPDSSSLSSVSTDASARAPTPAKYAGSFGRSSASTLSGKRSLPVKKKVYTGHELDEIEDLKVDDSPPRGAPSSAIGLGRPGRISNDTDRVASKGKRSAGATDARHTASSPRKKGGPKLIRPLRPTREEKTVKNMKWNPQACRWEGNETQLRSFDDPPSSRVKLIRPALITPLTSSSASAGRTASSGSAAGAPHIVGNMKFDPQKMCWVSILDPADEDPDPFEAMGGDDDDDYAAGGTIRLRKSSLVPRGHIGGSSRQASEASSSFSAASWDDPPRSSRALMGSGSGGGERAGVLVEGPTEALSEECKEARERHKEEMKGWIWPKGEDAEKRRSEEDRLWRIRRLKT